MSDISNLLGDASNAVKAAVAAIDSASQLMDKVESLVPTDSRSIVLEFVNATDVALNRVTDNFAHGGFGPSLPAGVIGSGSLDSFSVVSDGIGTGIEGSVTYVGDGISNLLIGFNNPFMGSNAVNVVLDGPEKDQLSLVADISVGNHAHARYVLYPPTVPAVRPQPSLYALSPADSSVFQWRGTGGDWVQIGGAATGLFAGAGRLFATNPQSGDLFMYMGKPMQWHRIGGPGRSFVVDGSGTLYGLAPDGSSVQRWSGSEDQWLQVGEPATALYAGGSRLYATSPADGGVFVYSGTPMHWSRIGGPGKAFAVDGSGTLYGLSPDGKLVLRFDGSAWTSIGTAAASLLAGGNRVCATSPLNGDLFLYSGNPESWADIGTAGKQFSIDGLGNIYGLSPAADGVFKWSGEGNSWHNIGGPATAIAAG